MTRPQELGDKKPRAQSAYNLFVKENMDKIKGSGEFENQKEVMTAIGGAWKNLDAAAKVQYQQKAEQQKAATALGAPQSVPKGLTMLFKARRQPMLTSIMQA